MMLITAVIQIHLDKFKYLEQFLEHRMHSINASYYINTILNCVSVKATVA